MKTRKKFLEGGDRYVFDFQLCSSDKGWGQFDTEQDAWYYGNWVNPFELKTLCYAEGDITIKEAENIKEFISELEDCVQWHNESGYLFLGIDPGFNTKLKDKFKELGLDRFFHKNIQKSQGEV